MRKNAFYIAILATSLIWMSAEAFYEDKKWYDFKDPTWGYSCPSWYEADEYDNIWKVTKWTSTVRRKLFRCVKKDIQEPTVTFEKTGDNIQWGEIIMKIKENGSAGLKNVFYFLNWEKFTIDLSSYHNSNQKVNEVVKKIDTTAEWRYDVRVFAEDYAWIWGKRWKMWNRVQFQSWDFNPVLIDREFPRMKDYNLAYNNTWTNQDPSISIDAYDKYTGQYFFDEQSVVCPNPPVTWGEWVVIKEQFKSCYQWEPNCVPWVQPEDCYLACNPGYYKVGNTCKKEYYAKTCRNADEFGKKSVFRPKDYNTNRASPLINSNLDERLVNLVNHKESYIDEEGVYYTELNPTEWMYEILDKAWNVVIENNVLCQECEYSCPAWYHKDMYTWGFDDWINDFECVSNTRVIRTEIDHMDFMVPDSVSIKNEYDKMVWSANEQGYYVVTNYGSTASSMKKTVYSTCTWEWTQEVWDWKCAGPNWDIIVPWNSPSVNPFWGLVRKYNINRCEYWYATLGQCALVSSWRPSDSETTESAWWAKYYWPLTPWDYCEVDVHPGYPVVEDPGMFVPADSINGSANSDLTSACSLDTSDISKCVLSEWAGADFVPPPCTLWSFDVWSCDV